MEAEAALEAVLRIGQSRFERETFRARIVILSPWIHNRGKGWLMAWPDSCG